MFRISEMTQSAILRIYAERGHISLNPDYQRSSEIWRKDKKQLFIDSIINGFDIPKIYLHLLNDPEGDQKYSVIDGKQRLETLWAFKSDKFPLSDDFRYIKDKGVSAGGLYYSELEKDYLSLAIQFDSYSLPIVIIETKDTDDIEDMFCRLNEASPLNAAEKRNALGGRMVGAIRSLADSKFFKENSRIPTKRYQHREVAVRLLFLTESLLKSTPIRDTKKTYLDQFVIDHKETSAEQIKKITGACEKTLERMSNLFLASDPLLRQQASVPIYFITFWFAEKYGFLNRLTRRDFEKFRVEVQENRKIAEDEKAGNIADLALLEYDRLSLQGTNDASSIVARVRIFSESLLGEQIDLYRELSGGVRDIDGGSSENDGPPKRKKITEEMTKEVCRCGDALLLNDMEYRTALEKLIDKGMNRGSAHIYLYNYLAMMEGKVFKRTMKAGDVEIFLKHIRKKHGVALFKRSVEALEKHVEYSKRVGNSTKLRGPLLDEMRAQIK